MAVSSFANTKPWEAVGEDGASSVSLPGRAEKGRHLLLLGRGDLGEPGERKQHCAFLGVQVLQLFL